MSMPTREGSFILKKKKDYRVIHRKYTQTIKKEIGNRQCVGRVVLIPLVGKINTETLCLFTY